MKKITLNILNINNHCIGYSGDTFLLKDILKENNAFWDNNKKTWNIYFKNKTADIVVPVIEKINKEIISLLDKKYPEEKSGGYKLILNNLVNFIIEYESKNKTTNNDTNNDINNENEINNNNNINNNLNNNNTNNNINNINNNTNQEANNDIIDNKNKINNKDIIINNISGNKINNINYSLIQQNNLKQNDKNNSDQYIDSIEKKSLMSLNVKFDKIFKNFIYNHHKEAFLKYINSNIIIDNSSNIVDKNIAIIMLIYYLLTNNIVKRIIITSNGLTKYQWQDLIYKWTQLNSIIIEKDENNIQKETIKEMSYYLESMIIIVDNKIAYSSINYLEFMKSIMFNYDTALIIDNKIFEEDNLSLNYKNLKEIKKYVKYFLYSSSININTNLNYIHNIVSIFYPDLIKFYKSNYYIYKDIYTHHDNNTYYYIDNIEIQNDYNIRNNINNKIFIFNCTNVNNASSQQKQKTFKLYLLNKSNILLNEILTISSKIKNEKAKYLLKDIYYSYDNSNLNYILKASIYFYNKNTDDNNDNIDIKKVKYIKTYLGYFPKIPVSYYNFIYKFKNVNYYLPKISNFYINYQINHLILSSKIKEYIEDIKEIVEVNIDDKQQSYLSKIKKEINNILKKDNISLNNDIQKEDNKLLITNIVDYVKIQNLIKKIKCLLTDYRLYEEQNNNNYISPKMNKILEIITKIIQNIKDNNITNKIINIKNRKNYYYDNKFSDNNNRIKIIIITQYKKMIPILYKYLSDNLKEHNNVSVYSINYDIIKTNEIAYQIFNDFKNNNYNNSENIDINLDILIMSDEIGLNIDFADILIHYDIAWNNNKMAYREENFIKINNIINKIKQKEYYLVNNFIEKEILDILKDGNKNSYYEQYLYYLITNKTISAIQKID